MKKARNKLVAIEDSNGVNQRGDKKIAEVAGNYFSELYTSNPASDQVYQQIFEGFQAKITDDINRDLIRDISDEEINEAIFSIGPHKAPGPDGFTGDFYHHFWDDIRPAIVKEVKEFFEDGKMDQIPNHTNLCLIPKVDSPMSMAEFRPTALCNVFYKIISKILVNQLKLHLSGIILENQAASSSFIMDSQ